MKLFAPMLRVAVAAFAAAFAGAAWAHPPRGIVVDGAGQVYFSDLRTIWKIDTAGRLSVARRGTEAHIHELAIDRQANVYGEQQDYRPSDGSSAVSAWRMSPDGRATYLLRPTRLPPPLGTSIWLDAARQSYLAQEATGSRQAMLFRRRPDGHVDVLLGGQEAAAGHRQVLTSGMGGAAFGPDGAFYFRHGAVLRKFSPQGRLVTLATDLPQENYGIAVGPDLAVYVAEFAAHRVVRIGHDGRRTIALTASGPWAPTGVAVRGGALYVLETRQLASGATAEIRVRKLAPGAPSVMLAAVPFS